MSGASAIYFDGRKDNTLVKWKVGDKLYSDIQKEEHIVLISEPGSEYMTHISPTSSKSKNSPIHFGKCKAVGNI